MTEKALCKKKSIGLCIDVSRKELDFYLGGQTAVLPVTIDESSVAVDYERPREANQLANSVDILQLRYKPGVEKEFNSSEEFNKLLNTIKTIPSQLQLCYSSIPLAGFGICAKDTIPSGSWIGPYEGDRIAVKDLQTLKNTKSIWEIYINGSVDHYVKANETGQSAWMKYIQCARNTTEQNAILFQFGADVFFQTYKEIHAGEELLVWYADYYEKHHDIPVGVMQANKVSMKEGRLENTTPKFSPTNPDKTQVHSIQMAHLASQPLQDGIRPPTNPDKTQTTSIQMIPSRTQPLQNGIVPPTKPDKTQLHSIQMTPVPTQPLQNGAVPPITNIPQPIITRTISLSNGKPPTVARLWRCQHCNVVFPQKLAVKVHKCPMRNVAAFSCSRCNKTFITEDDLAKHTTICNDTGRHGCGYCSRRFASQMELTKHLKVHSKRRMNNGKWRRGRISNYEKFVLGH